MTEQTNTRITGIPVVGVPVTDQDRAVAFYVETLGLEKRRDVPLPQIGGRWIQVAPSGADVTIALVPADDDKPTGVETGIRLGTPDAAALHAQLSAAGVGVGELLQWPGTPPMFAFRDQDGNRLEVVQ
ncbi:MAG: VOC family protein [Streptosporangiales bacterium]|nr:VOC family protein [Streptosporangiales bacterium]MBO0891667.1 VOC family protein [Acidothermales bacterium]